MSFPNESFFQFEKLLVGLARAGVDYAAVGGVAVSLNGFVRATEDVDILVQSSPENLRRLLDCLAHWGEGWARELKIEDFAISEGSIRVIEDFYLDIFVKMKGRTLEDFQPNLRFVESEGVRIPYLPPGDLIFLKEGSWRDKDKLDVAALKEIIAREAQP